MAELLMQLPFSLAILMTGVGKELVGCWDWVSMCRHSGALCIVAGPPQCTLDRWAVHPGQCCLAQDMVLIWTIFDPSKGEDDVTEGEKMSP